MPTLKIDFSRIESWASAPALVAAATADSASARIVWFFMGGLRSDPSEGAQLLRDVVADHLVAAGRRVHRVGELPRGDVGAGAQPVVRHARRGVAEERRPVG